MTTHALSVLTSIQECMTADHSAKPSGGGKVATIAQKSLDELALVKEFVNSLESAKAAGHIMDSSY